MNKVISLFLLFVLCLPTVGYSQDESSVAVLSPNTNVPLVTDSFNLRLALVPDVKRIKVFIGS